MAGLGLKTHQLDNEAAKAYKQCICQNDVMHELVPPDNHRSSLAEWAIQMFKHHFISILSGVDVEFPLSLWCALLEQTELTVNLLRQSNVVPKILAFVHVHGHHDYMKKPFAPIGCAVQVHVKLDVGHPHQSRIQPRDVNGAPPMLQDICHKNQSNKSQQHSIFQAPIYYQPDGLT